MSKKTILTGVKPSGKAHFGNYFGAMKPAISMANKSAEKVLGVTQSLLFIADYHALIVSESGEQLRDLTYDVAASWLACGLDPKKTIIYRQSDVPEIFELTWVISTVTPKGFMNRAHAYKAKVQANEDDGKSDLDAGVSMGLYSYPVLMAADILLFNTDEVPVGQDQIQHVEFARDIADKFNHKYGEVLKLPKSVIQKEVQTVPGLDGRKMSSSYNNFIPLFESEKRLRKLVMKIKTDSSAPEDPKDPDDSLIMDFYKVVASAEEVKALSERYRQGIGWGEAKQVLYEKLNEEIKEARERYSQLIADKNKLDTILADGAQRAREIARPVLNRVREAIGVRTHLSE